MDEIINGEHDDQISELADKCKELDRLTYIRFGYEFDNKVTDIHQINTKKPTNILGARFKNKKKLMFNMCGILGATLQIFTATELRPIKYYIHGNIFLILNKFHR